MAPLGFSSCLRGPFDEIAVCFTSLYYSYSTFPESQRGHCSRQPEARQFLSRRLNAGMDDAVDSQSPGGFHEHGAVLDVDHLRRLYLGYVEGDAVDVRIGFAIMDEAR